MFEKTGFPPLLPAPSTRADGARFCMNNSLAAPVRRPPRAPESPSSSPPCHTRGCLDSSGQRFLAFFFFFFLIPSSLCQYSVNARSVWAVTVPALRRPDSGDPGGHV